MYEMAGDGLASLHEATFPFLNGGHPIPMHWSPHQLHEQLAQQHNTLSLLLLAITAVRTARKGELLAARAPSTNCGTSSNSTGSSNGIYTCRPLHQQLTVTGSTSNFSTL